MAPWYLSLIPEPGLCPLSHLPLPCRSSPQEWARSQLDAAAAKAAARLSQFPAAAQEARATAEWGCPKCRTSYPATAVPREYRCFCGKGTHHPPGSLLLLRAGRPVRGQNRSLHSLAWTHLSL